jgi:hypothetical protein
MQFSKPAARCWRKRRHVDSKEKDLRFSEGDGAGGALFLSLAAESLATQSLKVSLNTCRIRAVRVASSDSTSSIV